MERLQQLHVRLKVLRPAVVVEAEDVRLLDLDARQRRHSGQRTPITVPQAAGERLSWLRGTGPGKDPRQKAQDDLVLIAGVALSVGAVIAIVRLIPHVPGQNARIKSECAHHSLDVALQARELRWVGKNLRARRLHPAGVMHAGDGRMLGAEPGVRIPAGVEEHEDRPDMMAGGDGKEGVHALLEAFGVLLPHQVVQKDPHGVHPDGFGPAQFAVDGGGVEAFGLPHLQLVDGRRGQKVGANGPGLLRIPCVGLRLRPTLLRVQGGDQGEQQRRDG